MLKKLVNIRTITTMEKKSYFSKKAIAEVIEETIKYINELDIKPNKEIVGAHLVAENKISDAIYDTLTGGKKDLGNCNAMVKKGRCGNPITKINNEFCALHTNNPPDMTYKDYERLKMLKKNSNNF